MAFGKDVKKKETPNREPSFGADAFNFNDRLALPEELKKVLTDQGLDWRFLNIREFRQSGNYHRSHWIPFQVSEHGGGSKETFGATPEGNLVRGDVMLGVRPKSVTAKHKAFLKERNRKYSNFNKTEAEKMRQHAKDTGLSDYVKVEEGYDEDEKGFN